MYTDQEKAREYWKRWRQKNKRKVQAQQAHWRERHPQYLRRWRKANPVKVALYLARKREKGRAERAAKKELAAVRVLVGRIANSSIDVQLKNALAAKTRFKALFRESAGPKTPHEGGGQDE